MSIAPKLGVKNRWMATIAGLVLTVCVAVIFFAPLSLMETIHGTLYDLSFKLRGPLSPPSDVAVVAIDDDSLARVGRWPWPRSTSAALIDRLGQAGAKVIALDIVFLPDPGLQNAAENLALQEAIRRAGNVVLPYYFSLGPTAEVAGPTDRDAAIASQSFLLFDDPKKLADYPPPAAANLFAPAPELAQSAKALGHINVLADPDGIVRRTPMILQYGEACYPAFTLQVAAAASGLTQGDITVRVGESIRLGKTVIPTDVRGMALVNYYGGSGTIRYVRAADVLEGKAGDALQNKIVLVGITAAGLSAGVQDVMETPFSNRFPGVEKHAQETASILQGRLMSRPSWTSFAEFGLLLIVGLVMALLLPVCRPVVRLILTLAVVLLCGGLSLGAFFAGLWLKPFLPALLAVLIFAAMAFMPSRSIPADIPAAADQTVILPPSSTDMEQTVRLDTTGPPAKIGRYEILGQLGQGAMGVVYKGKDPIINRLVAIKTIRFDRLYEEQDIQDMKARFFKEAQTAGKLIHPGIVTIFDVGDEKGLSFIAMEYVEGKNLTRFTDKGSLLPWTQVCTLMIDVAEALDFAHRQGIVHRDVKPANIMITGNDQVKVMDFGIAKMASSTLTQMGSILGTPAYMSPEQISGADVDGRSDLFSLGCVLYELLTGAKPFQGENIAALSHQILQATPVAATALNPAIPARLADVLDGALEKNPTHRFATGKQMADALRSVINASPR